MTEAQILSHLAALFAGVAGTYAYLRKFMQWKTPLEHDMALLVQRVGWSHAQTPLAPIVQSGAGGGSGSSPGGAAGPLAG